MLDKNKEKKKKMRKRVKAREKVQRKIRRKERSEVVISMIGGLIWFGILIFMWIMATGEEKEEENGGKKDTDKNLDIVNMESYEDDDEEDED